MTKPRGDGIDRLEHLVEQFTKSASQLMESNQQMIKTDHEKVDLMYDFLFVGKPDASPPVNPFVTTVQRNVEDVSDFKRSITRIIWMIVAMLITAGGAFGLAVYNHVFLVAPAP